MAASPEAMMGEMGGAPGGAPDPAAAGGGPPPPGAAAPMTPQQPKGEQASADASVQVAIRMLEHSLVAHGSHSEKGKAIMTSLTHLAKAFGKDEDKAQEIMPAEVKTALMAPSGPPGGGPQQGAPQG